MKVRFMAVGSARSDPPHFQHALGRAGVKTVADSDPRVACPAVIYFTGTCPELLPAVRRVGGGGRRVLVVAGRGADSGRPGLGTRPGGSVGRDQLGWL
jgi:hypothetical protein